MNLSWLGLYLFSSAWLLAAGVYEPVDRSWPYLAAAGALLFAASLPGLRYDRIPKKVYLLAAGPIVFALMMPAPYNFIAAAPLAGFALLLPSHKIRRLTPVAGGLLLAGGVLLLQSLSLALFYYVSPDLKDAGFCAPALHAFLRAFGSDAALGDGLVYVSTTPEIMRLWPTWDHLGLFHALLLASGALPILALSRSPKRNILILLLLVPAYFLLRYGVFSVVEASGTAHETYWSNTWNAISLLPLYLMMTLWMPMRRLSTPAASRLGGLSLDRRQLAMMACLGAATLAMTCYAGLADPGRMKAGRLLVDEFHSDWEWTEEEFDTEWYGIKSGYNYYNLFEYLNYFYRADRGKSLVTDDILSNYDVYIIKTPTKRYQESEIDAIVRFVEAGGGLYLIGDHTNVFGTSKYLNEISERFGFTYRYDSTYDLRSGALSVIEPSRLLPHAMVQNMPVFMFATSCTIQGDSISRPAQNGYRLRAVAADYSQDSFFPEKKEHRDYGFGLFTQTICAKRGKGRVAGFTDSTVFSNFFMFIPGKPELFLGTVEWLNRRNRFPWMETALAVAFLCLIVAAFALGRRVDPAPRALLYMAAVLVAIPLSLWAVREVNARNYPPPKPRTDFLKVSFEARHSFFFVPMVSLTSASENDFQTFYVWTQRLGLVPNVSREVDDAIDNGNLVVFIDPRWPFSPDEKEKLGSYVSRGGSVLLLDDRRNPYSTSNQLLSFFGMEMDTTRVVPSAQDSASGEVFLFDKAGSVRGGRPFLTTSDGTAIISYVQHGGGVVMACANSHLFELRAMGATGNEPDPMQRRIYDLEFDMLRKLLKL